MQTVTIDGTSHEAEGGERLIDVINRCGIAVPQVCYHPQLGPIQICDTWGWLLRSSPRSNRSTGPMRLDLSLHRNAQTKRLWVSRTIASDPIHLQPFQISCY